MKPPSQVPPYAPEFICDLPVTAHPREFRGRFKSLIPKINKAFVKLRFSNKDKCVIEISTRSGPKDLSLCDFQTLYDSLLFLRKAHINPGLQSQKGKMFGLESFMEKRLPPQFEPNSSKRTFPKLLMMAWEYFANVNRQSELIYFYLVLLSMTSIQIFLLF